MDLLLRSPRTAMSTATYLETGIVIDKARDAVLSRRLDELFVIVDVELAPVTPEQARIARAAYRDFGKGSGHPAGLDFGDWVSYALAIANGEPLLSKGNDFALTDVKIAAKSR